MSLLSSTLVSSTCTSTVGVGTGAPFYIVTARSQEKLDFFSRRTRRFAASVTIIVLSSALLPPLRHPVVPSSGRSGMEVEQAPPDPTNFGSAPPDLTNFSPNLSVHAPTFVPPMALPMGMQGHPPASKGMNDFGLFGRAQRIPEEGP